MTRLHLHVQADAYELRLEGEVLGRLAGGAAALLSGAGERLREIDIETAIERAEEWLMPASRRFQALELHVHDGTGRLRPLLGDQASFTTPQVEDVFDRTHAAVVRGQVTDRGAVADVVLLRELAHHGRLSRLVLNHQLAP